MIEWIWPWLLLLAPLPWLVRRLLPAAHSQQPALRAPFYDEWQQLERRAGRRAVRGSVAARRRTVVAVAAIAAGSGRAPMWIGEPIELPNSGRDLMMAVDISGSMQVEDMQVGQSLVSRVDAVRQVGAEFISQPQRRPAGPDTVRQQRLRAIAAEL